MNFARLAAIAALMSVGAAHAVPAPSATTYDYSYTFSTGDVVSGSFVGTATGSGIDNITDVTLILDGQTEFSGGSSGGYYGANAYVSTDGSFFDFYLSDHNSDAAFFGDAGGMLIEYTSSSFTVFDESVGILSITPVVALSAVPEPANAALLMAGIGLMGVVARRRKGSKQA
jgi:hypothetical protein